MSDLIERDYMGVLERRHYISEQPVLCVGAPLPEHAITEITLYQAAYCESTKRVFKRAPLFRLRMTESQFGQMIADPSSGTGEAATLEYLIGHRIVDTADSLAKDPHRAELRRQIDKAIGGDEQTRRFLQESIEQVDACSANGKMGVKHTANLTKLLRLILSNLPINETYSMTMVREAAANRTNAVAASMHQYIRTASSGLQQGLPSPMPSPDGDKPASAASVLSISASTISGAELFDDVMNTCRQVSFCLRSAELDGDGEDGQAAYSARAELYRFCISPEQYARWLRLEHGEISCTILRRGNVSAGRVPDAHTSNISRQWKEQKAQSTVNSAFYQEVQRLIAQIDAGEFKGKIGLSRLQEALSAIQSLYQTHVEQNMPAMEQTVSDVLLEQQQALTRYGQQQLQLLPADMQQRIATQLVPLLSAITTK